MGLCYNNQQVDLNEVCLSPGFRGELTQLRNEKTRKPHKSSFSLVKSSKKKCQVVCLTSNPSSDVKSNLIYSRSEELSNHTQSQDTNRSTPLAGLSRNIDIGLQSQKVLKSFPGLSHHRRRRNNMLLWITSCFEEINFIWVSAWSYLNRTPYIIQPKGHDTRS